MVASFPRPGLYGLSFVTLAPLLSVSRSLSDRQAFAVGWFCGAVFYMIAWRWVLPTIARFEDISLLAAGPFFALFVIYHALQIGLFAAIGARISLSDSLLAPAGVAGAWVILESCFPRVIGWHLGDALAPATLLRQMADLGGVYLLSLFIVFVNSLIATAVVPGTSSVLHRTLKLSLALGLTACAVFYGVGAASREPEPQASEIEIVVIQGVVASGREDLTATNEAAWEKHRDLTLAASRPEDFAPDLIIWPETSLRAYLRHESVYSRRLNDLTFSVGSPLLIGSLDFEPRSRREFNSAFLFSPYVEPHRPAGMQIYRKRRLLPFGEAVPSWLPWQTTGDFVAAEETGPSTLKLPSGDAFASEFAPSICFEAIFTGAFNKAVAAGASFLVNITDDGWFGDSDEPYQHLNATILRAVETRRWLVRASNSGISAFVDPQGAVVATTMLGSPRVLSHAIKTSSVITPYVRYGNWPVWLALGILALMTATTSVTKRSRDHAMVLEAPTSSSRRTQDNEAKMGSR